MVSLMAKNKRKLAVKQHKQQQKKAQRRQARVQKQQAKQPLSHAGMNKWQNDRATMEDMRILFPQMSEEYVKSSAATGPLMEAVEESYAWAEQPEFENIEIEPLSVTFLLMRLAEERGLAPETFVNPGTDEEVEQGLEVIESIAETLLTDKPVVDDIFEALIALRTRFKRQGNHYQAAQVTAVRMMMQDTKNPGAISQLPLVHALILRAINAGLTLLKVVGDSQVDAAVENVPLTKLKEKLLESKGVEHLEEVISSNPYLKHRLDKQIDEMYDHGHRALFSSKLTLGIFTTSELVQARAILLESAGVDDESEVEDLDQWTEVLKKCMSLLKAMLKINLTHERVEDIRAQLQIHLNDSELGHGPFAPFILMFYEHLAEEDGVERESNSLLMALVGELWVYLFGEEEEEEEVKG